MIDLYILIITVLIIFIVIIFREWQYTEEMLTKTNESLIFMRDSHTKTTYQLLDCLKNQIPREDVEKMIYIMREQIKKEMEARIKNDTNESLWKLSDANKKIILELQRYLDIANADISKLTEANNILTESNAKLTII